MFLLEEQSEAPFLHLSDFCLGLNVINWGCIVIDFILNKTSNPLGEKQRKVRLAKETEKILFQ